MLSETSDCPHDKPKYYVEGEKHKIYLHSNVGTMYAGGIYAWRACAINFLNTTITSAHPKGGSV